MMLFMHANAGRNLATCSLVCGFDVHTRVMACRCRIVKLARVVQAVVTSAGLLQVLKISFRGPRINSLN